MSKKNHNQKDKNPFQETIEETIKAVIIGETFTKLLSPISDEIPLLLLPVCGIPIIEFMLDSLLTANVKEIIICVKFNGNKIENYFEKYHKNLNIKIIASEEINSVGDCLRKINAGKSISNDFFLIRGLSITNVDFEKIYDAHKLNKKLDKNCMVTSLLKTYKNEMDIKTDYDENIIIYNEETKKIYQYESTFDKPYTKLYDNISFKENKVINENDKLFNKYIIRNDLFDSFIDVCSPSVLNVFQENFDYHDFREHLYKSILTSEIYFDTFYLYELTKNDYLGVVRNIESYFKINFEIINRWAYPITIENILISPELNIQPYQISYSIYSDKKNTEENYSKVNLLNAIAIGKETFIGANSTLNRVILGKNIKIGKNCNINNSIIFDNTIIEDDCNVAGSIIGMNCKINAKLNVKNSIFGKDVDQKDDCENVHIYYSIEENEEEKEEKILENINKELFIKNLEENDFLFLCKNPSEIYLTEDEIKEKSNNVNKSLDSDSVISSSNDSESEEENNYDELILNIINNGLEMNSNKEDIIKELAALKNAYYYKTNMETLKVCFIRIVLDFLKESNFKAEHIQPFTQLLIEWNGLFKRFIPNFETQIEFISVIELLCNENEEIQKAFHIILQIFNSEEVNVISDEAIKKWYSNGKSEFNTSEMVIQIPDEIYQENKRKMKTYIEENL